MPAGPTTAPVISSLISGGALFPLSYNGVQWRNDSTVSVDARAVLDSAQRMVKYTEYDFTLTGYVLAQDPGDISNITGRIDLQMDEIRRKLFQAGGLLVLNSEEAGGVGFGFFTARFSADMPDVMYGPMPLSFNMKPVAHDAAWFTTFKVRVRLAGECDSHAFNGRKGVLAYNYKVSWSHDRDRYTRRVHSGSVRILGYRKDVATTSISDSADRLKEAVYPPLIPGFRRTQNEWNLSEDKAEATWAVTDEEDTPNSFLQDVTSWDGSATASAKGPIWVRWVNTLSASYTLAPTWIGDTIHKRRAFSHFSSLLRTRVNAAVQNVRSFKNPNAGGTDVAAVIPMSMTMSEPEISGRKTATFSCSWFFITDAHFALASSGLWAPVAGASWSDWQGSLANILGPRGNAGLTFDPSEDILVNLCNNQAPFEANVQGRGKGNSGINPSRGKAGGDGATLKGAGLDSLFGANPVFPVAGVPGSGEAKSGQPDWFEDIPGFSATSPDPTPQTSWIDVGLSMRLEVTDHVAEMKLLPAEAVKLLPGPASMDSAVGTTVPYRAPTQPSSIAQVRAYPTIYLVLEGHAVRAKYNITCPAIIRAGQMAVVSANRDGTEFFEARSVQGIKYPFVFARWRQRWLVAGPLTQPVTAPVHPMTTAVSSGAGGLPASTGLLITQG